MNDDWSFDPVDDELRRRFGDQAADPGDADRVLDELRPRLRRARTRRRAAFSGALATVAVLLVLAVVALSGGGGRGSVRTPPAGGAGDVRPGPGVTTTVPQPTVTTLDDHGGGGSGADDSTVTTPGPADGAGTGGTGGTGAATPAADPVPPSAPTVRQESYSSAGGSIVVTSDGTAVSLVSQTAATGYTAEVHDNGPTRVEVRFDNGQTEWRIRVDLVNGDLVPEVSQH